MSGGILSPPANLRPPGLEFDRYEVVAKTPPGATEKDTALMLQSLLADRFKLSVKLETKPLPAFVLKAGSGAAKMKPAADATGEPNCQVADPPPPGTPALRQAGSFS